MALGRMPQMRRIGTRIESCLHESLGILGQQNEFFQPRDEYLLVVVPKLNRRCPQRISSSGQILEFVALVTDLNSKVDHLEIL